jgi:CDP-paratose synthetase
VIQGILNVLHSDLPSATGGYWEIPVGTGIAPTISEVIDYLWEKTGKKSKVNKGAIPQRKNEPDCVADNSMLLSIGPWSPAFWKDGLEQMIIQLRDTYGKE